MQVLYGLYHRNYSFPESVERIDLLPRNNSLKSIEKFHSAYKTPDPCKGRDCLNALWGRVQHWVCTNYPSLDPRAVRFSTYHLASHFALNYASASRIVELLVPKLGNTVGVICDEEMLWVEPDWTGSIITLLATVDVLEAHYRNVEYFGTESNAVSNLFDFAQGKYIALDNISSLGGSPNVGALSRFLGIGTNFFYGLTRRYLPGNLGSIRFLRAKSLVSSDIESGLSHQFEGDSGLSVGPANGVSWAKYCICTSEFSKKVESAYFDFIGRRLIDKIANLEPFYIEILNSASTKKCLILEELVDIEIMSLMSAWLKSSNDIYVVQHSSNPLPCVFTPPEDTVPYIKRIYANNKDCARIYRSSNAVSEIDFVNVARAGKPLIKTDGSSEKIVLIENDWFRRFGVGGDITQLIYEVATFVLNVNKHGDFKYVWKQRTLDFIPLYEYLQSLLPGVSIAISDTRDFGELLSNSRVSVSFGSTSSLALDLLNLGAVNVFGSQAPAEAEYVPCADRLFLERGPIFSAIEAVRIATDYEYYLSRISAQQQIAFG